MLANSSPFPSSHPRMKQLLTFLLFFACFQAFQAQTTRDVTVPLSATYTTGPVAITLNWPNPGNANLLIQRRKKGLSGIAWQSVLSQSNSDLTTFTDPNGLTGNTYEYRFQRTLSNITANGFVIVAIDAPPVDSRGKILIFVDSTTADALGPELVRLKNDMRGDGWWPIPFHTGPYSTVQSIKDQIVANYNADPNGVKAVLLLGTVPIPYSGDFAWDGHADHYGAWPSDAYYADVNGVWTDNSINDTSPGRAANVNVPGDGKFDQSYLPTPVELQIGRVDFRRINAQAFGAADQNGLMKRYLDKDHLWRSGGYIVENKALVDDNFGYFSGEAFAASGYRNAYPLVGEANVVDGDFFLDTNPQSYLLGYGCGGGWYQGAGGVGSSADFATDSINIVFSNLFGSYFGDWDYESDPFMPSALASRGGILTCSWAGRPQWFNHALACGETIGYCAKETMNASTNNGFYNSTGKGGAHVVLLGDPTLRAHVLKPATDLVINSTNCETIELFWTESADTVLGYHIYRAPSQDGPYTRLTTNPIGGNHYTDYSPVLGTLFYQVRAIKNVSTPGGGTYANNSTGPIKSIVFVQGPEVNASASGMLNCNISLVQLQAGNTIPAATYSWVGPNNFSSFLPDPIVSIPGTYTVVVIVGNCSTTDNVEVIEAPLFTLDAIVTPETVPNANNGAIDISVGSGIGPFTYLWSNGATTEDLTGLSGGNYTVTVVDVSTFCTSTSTVHISTTSEANEAQVFEQFLLSPNPTKGPITLSLKLHTSASVRVTIQDLRGRVIWEAPVRETHALTLPIDLTQSPAGSYTLSVWIGDQVFVRKFVVIR